ncbi:MAG: DUF1624 domain-containing protein [Myxococcales bacterium]|nr:DUF1624 domain-containing protein [Myxococcales bacterium]
MSTKGQIVNPVGARFDHVDAMRGIAVLLMIWMHTGDGWLAAPFRQGASFDLVRSPGGLAAPLFLLLVGISLGLRWSQETFLAGGLAGSRGNSALRSELARGLQILLLGYLLRVQMWMLDGAGYRHWTAWAAALPLTFAYLGGYLLLGRWARGRLPGRRALGWAGAAGFSWALGFWSLWAFTPARVEGVLRQDVLQAIGASLVLVACFGRALGVVRHPLAWPCLLAAALVALLTPAMRAWVPGPLPGPLAGYLGYWNPGPGRTPAGLFPLFPWLAYPFVGVALGRHFGLRGPRGALTSALVLALFGLLLAALSSESRAPVRALMAAEPWLQQPLRVLYRVAMGLILGGLAVVLSRPRVPGRRGLLLLGQASLAVYWVHLELAFGIASRPVSRRLALDGWLLGWALLSLAMVGFAWLWLRRRELWLRLVGRFGAGGAAIDGRSGVSG